MSVDFPMMAIFFAHAPPCRADVPVSTLVDPIPAPTAR
jgi:hypothetical protein